LNAARTALIHGWLFWETAAFALTATVVLVVVGECTLLLSGGIAAAWGLLANSHAELYVCKLVLHCNKAVGLALHGLLHGGKLGTEVCKRVTVQVTNALSSMAVILYPSCKAKTAV
jgi:hypothetical protein